MPTLQHSAAVQDILFHELHHRFYNSLQLVSSAIGVLASEQRPDKIRVLRDRIAMLGRLHRMLAKPMVDIDEMREALDGVCTSLTSGFGRGKVSLNLEAMIFPEDPMIVRGLALIMVELVTNALKYGVNDRAPVCVVLSRDDRCFRLSVFNEAASSNCADACHPYVATRFAEALGGTLTVTSTPKHLVHIVVSIPDAMSVINGDIG